MLPGDLALRKSIRRAYQLDHLPTPEEVLRIAEPWRPYRSLATAYLFQAGFETPGPAHDRSPRSTSHPDPAPDQDPAAEDAQR